MSFPTSRIPVIRRYIFNTLTVVSLLLMLGALGLWGRGWIVND